MRDPARIDPVLDKIREVWYANPDLRLGQLIENCTPIIPGKVYYMGDRGTYAMEDDVLLRRLDEVYGPTRT